MSVATLSETRTFDRALEYAREKVLPGIVQNAIDASPIMSIFAGKISDIMFGSGPMGGKGKVVHSGGESIVNKARLGVNTTRKALTSKFDTFDTTPSDTVRHGRANWKIYGDFINLSKYELRITAGEYAVANLVQEESQDAVSSLVDLLAAHIFENGGSASRISCLDDLISANDSVQGLSGATYSAWNSRGVSTRGTAAGSVSFTGGSFATTGLTNWRLAWNNVWEGNITPQVLVTTHPIYGYYEGSLQPQERFMSNALADGGFMNLQFKSAPIFADPNATSGVTYFLNLDYLKLNILGGADFTVGEFKEAETQDVITAKVVFTGNLGMKARKFENKVSGQTA